MGLSRRSLLLGGAGLGVAVAVPAGQHVAWGGRSFIRPGYDPAPPVAEAGEASWMNWSGIERATPRALAFPESEEALAGLIAGAEGRVRPVGSGHSFSALAPSEDVMVFTGSLAGLLSYNTETGEAEFGAGSALYEVAETLSGLGRALPNLPDIDVQTLAGSFATGTHGTGNELTALHDYVTGFRIILASGEVRDVDAASDPSLFAAGKVSLGALGVITRYRIATVPAFRLRREVHSGPVEGFLERVPELSAVHRNFEFFAFPGTGMVAWITHDITDEVADSGEANDDDGFLEGLKQLRDTFGWFPWLRRRVAGSAFPTGLVEERVDDSFALLSTTRPIRFNEMEYHLPREAGPQSLGRVLAMMDRKKDAFFPMEYRHIAGDGAWLSPFNGGPCASIAIHAAVDEPYDYFFEDFEPVFRAAGGRPHWGKLHSLGAADFAALYPEFEAFSQLRADLDPQGKFLNPHLAHVFGVDFDG